MLRVASRLVAVRSCVVWRCCFVICSYFSCLLLVGYFGLIGVMRWFGLFAICGFGELRGCFTLRLFVAVLV